MDGKLNFSSPAAKYLTIFAKKSKKQNEIKDLEKARGRDCLIAFLPCSHSTASGGSIFFTLTCFQSPICSQIAFQFATCLLPKRRESGENITRSPVQYTFQCRLLCFDIPTKNDESSALKRFFTTGTQT